jgi:hypothetical protein
MSSNACDSRAARVNVACGGAPGHVPRKHLYTAITETGDVYDVLKTRTSEKKGAAAEPGGRDAAAGNVKVSAETDDESAKRTAARAGALPTVTIRRRRRGAVYDFPGESPSLLRHLDGPGKAVTL